MASRNTVFSRVSTASRFAWTAVAAAVLAGACGGGDEGGRSNAPTGLGPDPTGFDPGSNLSCDLPAELLFDGGAARDGIPSLINPPLVPVGDPALAYLDEWAAIKAQVPQLPDTRVIGMVVNGEPIAIPHNILWWHEIANFDLGGTRLAITFCPLTGSAIVFDATAAGVSRFGVSGLVWSQNLLMFDDETESLWPQMFMQGRCGLRTGKNLTSVPAIEMRWEVWKQRHPDTRVVSGDLGFGRDYARYPYDLYESGEFTLFPQPGLDRTLGVKERLLGIPDGSGGVAFPFAELDAIGPLAVVNRTVAGLETTVLWDREAFAAQGYEPRTATGPATLEVNGNTLVDRETSSIWTVEGDAIEGPRQGEKLIGIPRAFVAFWFAWAEFHPDTEIWIN